jgi:hypothetical protein
MHHTSEVSWRDAAVAWQKDISEALGSFALTKTNVLKEIARLKKIEAASLELLERLEKAHKKQV